MERMNRRKFLETTGKLTLAGTAALSIGPAISTIMPYPIKLAFASSSQSEFYVFNEVNPNVKDIVVDTFKDTLAKNWLPGICYETSKPMVAVAGGTVTEIIALEEYIKDKVHASAIKKTLMDEENEAKGFFVTVTHGNNYRSLYLHLKKPEVKFGQKLKREQIIGYPDERWNMPRLVFMDNDDPCDPNNYGMNHSYMNYWDGSTDLHISKEEQRERFQARLEDPRKHWKVNPKD